MYKLQGKQVLVFSALVLIRTFCPLFSALCLRTTLTDSSMMSLLLADS